MIRLLIALTDALAPPASAQAAPEFGDGDVTRLSAQVVAAEPVARSVASAIARVRVKNGGDRPAEPLAFRFAPAERKGQAEPLTVLRVAGPHFGRAGRAIAPGESAEYFALVPLEAKIAKSASVVVATAGFLTGAFSLENPVRILGSELENTAPFELDVVLRARFAAPMKAESLIEVRLPASARREVLIDELPTERDRGYSEAEIVDLEVVDWCAIVTRGEERARALLAETWDTWYRLPDDLPGLRGSFTYHFEQGASRVDAAGAFQLSRDGAIRVEPPAGQAVVGALRDAFRDVSRPAVAEALDGLVVELFELGGPGRASIVRLDRAPFLGANSETFLGLVDGRIAWSSGSRAPLPRETWIGRALAVDARSVWIASGVVHHAAFQSSPVETRRTRYESIGTVFAPVDFRTTWSLETFADSAKSTHVTLSDVSIGTAIAPVPPTGELADALRAAWDAVYRYPDAPKALVGRYAIETPATDGVWHGQRKVQGTFRLEGFRGRSWDRAEVSVDGRNLSQAMRDMLANAVVDRFHLFAHRDFAGRSPFDRAFAGATLAGDRRRIQLEFAPFTAIEIANGIPAALERPGGSRRTLEFARSGKVLVPTTIATDGETIRAAWTDLGDGWMFPKELVYEHVFGPDWGPETIRLTKLAVE